MGFWYKIWREMQPKSDETPLIYFAADTEIKPLTVTGQFVVEAIAAKKICRQWKTADAPIQS